MLTQIDITNIPEVILAAEPNLTNAVANDGLDDSRVIQVAINWFAFQRSAGFTGESTIYIPEGVFDLARTLKVNASGITFEGVGAGRTILKNADSFKVGIEGLPDSGVKISSVNRDSYLFDLNQNADELLFTNMTLTGSDVHGAIFGFKADRLKINSVEFKDFVWSSLRLFNVSNAKIHDNVFINAGGRAKETSGITGGAIYATFLSNSEIYNNHIYKTEERKGNVFGIKGRQFTNTRIHHNTIETSFAIELPFQNDQFIEIDHNFLGGTVSIPKFAGGAVPRDGFTFHVHHNYFTASYAFEWARNGVEIDHNVFAFDVEKDGGNLISNFGAEPAEGSTRFHNNLILNPGRGIFWSKGVYNNFSFYNNEVIANETATSRTEGLFSFNSETDFNTVEIRDNIIQINGIPRPLIRDEASYDAVIQNNKLINIRDIDQFDNPDTGASSGLIKPLLFQVGVNSEFTVDGADLRPAENKANIDHATDDMKNTFWEVIAKMFIQIQKRLGLI